jgi:putative tryptophan/tyrosine transport system substrate-binding protein
VGVRANGAALPSRRVPRIGLLVPPGTSAERLEWLQEGLREHGYLEGESILVERRFGETSSQLPGLAAELVGLNVDIIVAFGPSIPPAISATKTIPIVMLNTLDPVGAGYVVSLARPGGNVTGLSFLGNQLSAKRLQLLKEVVPNASRLAVMWAADGPSLTAAWEQTRQAADALGVPLRRFQVGEQPDFSGVFETMAQERIGGLIVLPDNFMTAHLSQIVALATRDRLPAIYPSREWATAGGLMAFGPSFRERYQRAAYYVDRILKGARPADLPVEQPTTFEFIVNVKTARTLGLTIPQSALQQVTELIQ